MLRACGFINTGVTNSGERLTGRGWHRQEKMMQLEYKSDWEETKARYRAFRAREYFGRAAIAVTAPLDNPPDDPPPPQRPATPHACALLKSAERWSVGRG
jgi:hypothetical protein